MKSKLIGAFMLAFIGLGTMSASAKDNYHRSHRGYDRHERRHEGGRDHRGGGYGSNYGGGHHGNSCYKGHKNHGNYGGGHYGGGHCR